ncbi:MAG: hypothetical protein H7841_07425 [Magnetospirillum sp. WYHS-4]
MFRNAAALILIFLAVAPARAAEDKTRFMGQEVKPLEATFLVVKDFTLKSRPDNEGKAGKVVEKGERLRVVGRTHPSGWLAVRDDKGKDLGFIHESATVPTISGKLPKDIRAKAATGDGIPCEYNIHFEGTTPIEDEAFETADYEVWFRCDLGQRKATFPTTLFITEAPYQMVRGGEFQISLDLLELRGEGDDTVLTTNLFYDFDKQRVRYDGASQDKLVQAPAEKERTVADVPSILTAAVELTLKSWTRKTLSLVRQ